LDKTSGMLIDCAFVATYCFHVYSRSAFLVDVKTNLKKILLSVTKFIEQYTVMGYQINRRDFLGSFIASLVVELTVAPEITILDARRLLFLDVRVPQGKKDHSD